MVSELYIFKIGKNLIFSEQKMVINVVTDSFFLKVTLYSVAIVIKLPQKHQYVHLTAYDYSF